MLNTEQALACLERHGAMMASAQGPVPRLTEAIVGEPIRGSWWSHPQGKRIFATLRALEDSPDVLVSKLAHGKVTFVHRRLWPALVRLADRIGHARLAQIRDEHTVAGKHLTRTVEFPQWVPRATLAAAKRLDEAEAARILEPLLAALEARPGSAARKRTSSR